MVKHIAAILVFSIVLFGCKNTPEGILDKEKMVAVYTDIHIAEGRLRTVGIFADSAKLMAPVLYDEVYRTHQISREEFIKSYNYYQANPKEFEAIVDRVLEELSKKESGIK